MEGLGDQLPDPNPVLSTEELTGADMSEPFARLAGMQVDTLTIDGFRFAGVDSVDSGRDSGITTVTCTDETGGQHFFIFRPDSESSVTHLVITD